jgi:hypothetical protein
MDAFVSKTATAVFQWLDFIIAKNLPFNVVEDPQFRKYVTIPPITIKTLQKYAHILVELVEEKIKTCLAKHEVIGLVFDGWGENLLYFISLFVVTPDGDYNIAFTTMEDEEHHDAANVAAFIEDVLLPYGK